MKEPSIHELKVTLRWTKPPIWRRVAVPSDCTLGELNEIIQIVMGWTNSHMHQFMRSIPKRKPTKEQIREQAAKMVRADSWTSLDEIFRGERYFSDPLFQLEDTADEHAVTLAAICPAVKNKLTYTYDFGDSWEHLIEVVKIHPPAADARYPRCLAGSLAAPPEDCGGVPGYYHLLGVLADPKHEEHADMLEWLGGSFDPAAFDLDAVNAALNDWRRPRKRRGRKPQS